MKQTLRAVEKAHQTGDRTMKPDKKRLVLINGPMGVGKTATCEALLDALQPAAFLDGDWCWTMRPWTVNARNIAMVEKNIAFVLGQYLSNPEITNVILGWVMHQTDIITRLVKTLRRDDTSVHVFSLICSPAALEARIRADVEKGKRDLEVLERSLERLALYEKMPWPKLDVSQISAKEAAVWIAEHLHNETSEIARQSRVGFAAS